LSSEDGESEDDETTDLPELELSSDDSGELSEPKKSEPKPRADSRSLRDFFIGTPTVSDDDVAVPAEQSDQALTHTKLFVGNVRSVRRVHK